MNSSALLEIEFFVLILCSLVLPIGISVFLLKTRAISRNRVLLLASVMIALSAADVVLLQALAKRAAETVSVVDDRLFLSELSIALYLLPAVFAGIGINLISHVLIKHLNQAEYLFMRDRRSATLADPAPHAGEAAPRDRTAANVVQSAEAAQRRPHSLSTKRSKRHGHAAQRIGLDGGDRRSGGQVLGSADATFDRQFSDRRRPFRVAAAGDQGARDSEKGGGAGQCRTG